MRQLEESRTKIENLMDWLSNVEKDSGRAGMEHMQVMEQNGTHVHESDGRSVAGEEDEVNGNLLEADLDGGTTGENLNQQYQRVKVRCVNGDAVTVCVYVGDKSGSFIQPQRVKTFPTPGSLYVRYKLRWKVLANKNSKKLIMRKQLLCAGQALFKK